MEHIKTNAKNRLSENQDPLPELECSAVYRLNNGTREWAILNGWNAGRWTFQFGPYCLADDHDTKSIAEAILRDNQGCVVVYYKVGHL